MFQTGAAPHADVLQYTVAGEESLLKYNSHIAQDGVVVQPLDIFPADQHLALLHIIEAGDQFDYGALAGAGLPHQGQPLSVPDFEIDALQHIGFTIIGKPHIPQFNIMVADVYSHIIDEDRCINAQRLEEAFYSSKTPDPVEDTEPETADTAVTESDESDAVKILELLKNPETAALLKQLAKAL